MATIPHVPKGWGPEDTDGDMATKSPWGVVHKPTNGPASGGGGHSFPVKICIMSHVNTTSVVSESCWPLLNSETDNWTGQEAVYTNKQPFTIMSSIFEVYGKGVTL